MPARLGACLALVPPSVRMAVEFRHASWFDEEVYGILRDRNAALCVADTEAGTTPARRDRGLRLPAPPRSRVHAGGALPVGEDRHARAEWRDAFVYFKHEESGTGPSWRARC